MPGRARFRAAPGVTQAAVRMVVRPTQAIADRVGDHARTLAPPTIQWITVEGANGPCNHCRPLHGEERPEGLRFGAKSFPWDMGQGRREHGGDAPIVGPITYLLFPRDKTSDAYVFYTHCQCVSRNDPNGIAKLISVGEPVLTADKVTVTVVAEGPYVVASEVGTVYPDGQVSHPKRFMGGAVVLTAAELDALAR